MVHHVLTPGNVVPKDIFTLLEYSFKYLEMRCPGIINGGIVSSLFDCHGNWTAAIALMDKAKLPRPPLTLTAELLVRGKCVFLLALLCSAFDPLSQGCTGAS